MANGLDRGVFCVSVDDADSESASAAERRRQTSELLEQFDVPSNWTVGDPRQPLDVSVSAEVTARAPSSVGNRGEFVRYLRDFRSVLSANARMLTSVAVDPYHARTYWDVLVRLGCLATRPRLSNPTRFIAPQSLRGGLWNIPVSCAFAGGSAKTVRSQFGLCRARLIESAHRGQVFHVSVDVGNSRSSWIEEVDALRALLHAARQQHHAGRLRFATLGALPGLLAHRRTDAPQRSILRPAA